MEEIVKPKPEKKANQNRQKPQDKFECQECSLNDAFKFGIFALRTAFAGATGRVIGDVTVDSALGDAIASIYNPQDLVDQGTQYAIIINGAAGAWKAVEGGKRWE